jgi:hypothetical protein
VDTAERRGLMGFWVEWGWIGDVSNLAYSEREGVCDFFSKRGGFSFGRVYKFVPNIRGMSGVVGWPSTNTNMFLITHRDLKFGVSDKGIKGVILPDEEPRVVDEFKG